VYGSSNPNSFNLAETHLILAPVVELRGFDARITARVDILKRMAEHVSGHRPYPCLYISTRDGLVRDEAGEQAIGLQGLRKRCRV
jgi:hypothetical protein